MKSNYDNLFPEVRKKIIRTDVVLDIGCGIQPQMLIRPAVHICLEPFYQYVEKLQSLIGKEHDRHYVTLQGSWSEGVKFFPPKSVDTVFLLDIIEHLEKKEALALLEKTKKIARVQVIVFTTLGLVPQFHPDGKDAWGLDGGSWQEHKSGWYPEDFGEAWDIQVIKDFHKKDNMGRSFEKPYGALWAIYNAGPYAGDASKQALQLAADIALEARNPKRTIKLLNLIRKVNRLLPL